MFLSEVMSWGIFLELIHYKHRSPHDPAPFMNHSFYSIYLAVTVFVLLYQFYDTKSVKYRVFIGLFILSAVVNLFINGGRLGQLAFFVAILVYGIIKYGIRLKPIVLSISILAVVSVVAYQSSPVFHERVNHSGNSLKKIYSGNFHNSWGMRAAMVIVSKDVFLDHPLFGAGLGSARTEFLEKSKKYPLLKKYSHFRHLHNEYMQILTETGLIGFSILIWFVCAMFKLKLPKEQFVLMSVIISIYLVGFVGEPLFFARKPFLLFIFFSAFFIARASAFTEKKDSNV